MSCGWSQRRKRIDNIRELAKTSSINNRTSLFNIKSSSSQIFRLKSPKNKQDILRDTFYEMTKWRTNHSATRSHTADESSKQQFEKYPHKHFLMTFKKLQQSREAFTDQACLNFVPSNRQPLRTDTLFFKKKDQKKRRGLSQLARKLAQMKPLGINLKIKQEKPLQKDFRLRPNRLIKHIAIEKQVTILQQKRQESIPRAVCNANHKYRLKRQLNLRQDIKVSPWHDQGLLSPTMRHFCLSDILE